MKMEISGHHVEVTPALKDYVTSKMKKLENHFNHITSIHVVLDVAKKHQQKAEAEVHLAGGKGKLEAHSTTEDMYASIDALVTKLDRQVIKHKEKLQDHGHGNHHDYGDSVETK